jgi:hypothetical protein
VAFTLNENYEVQRGKQKQYQAQGRLGNSVNNSRTLSSVFFSYYFYNCNEDILSSPLFLQLKSTFAKNFITGFY